VVFGEYSLGYSQDVVSKWESDFLLQTVFVVDSITHISMLYHGFKYHRTSLTPLPTIFPPRPLALLTTHRSPVNKLSYWLRPHTSKTSLPIVFLHGIGIGLWTYVNSLAALNAQKVNNDGEVGIIAIELLPISFRITHSALGKEEMCRQIQTILLQHGYEKFVLVTHSWVPPHPN
jgi:pimeloyl-ACP methyl ester carboxylesterase